MKKIIQLSAKIISAWQRMVVAKGDLLGREWKKGRKWWERIYPLAATGKIVK